MRMFYDLKEQINIMQVFYDFNKQIRFACTWVHCGCILYFLLIFVRNMSINDALIEYDFFSLTYSGETGAASPASEIFKK